VCLLVNRRPANGDRTTVANRLRTGAEGQHTARVDRYRDSNADLEESRGLHGAASPTYTASIRGTITNVIC
jgi:hypothetical protein